MSKAIKIARGLGLVIILVTYAVLVHHVNVSAQPSTLGAILALAPICLLVITYAWQIDSRIMGISLFLMSCFACWLAWPFVRQHTGFIFWIQDIGLMLILLLTFARTLQKNRKPLCVHFAEIINGEEPLSPEHANYARQVTVAWVVFFCDDHYHFNLIVFSSATRNMVVFCEFFDVTTRCFNVYS